ncbi:MAG: four helix bundle protein [Clostridia bacterium]|nr:four helix bundle protein [Clostridia bacterium]
MEQLNFIDIEEKQEDAPQTLTQYTDKDLGKVARKPFVLKYLDPPRAKEKEMAVFTNSKKLAEYIFVITEKSPKKFRWNIVSRLQNTSIDVIDNLYQANFEKDEKRLFYQTRAGVSLRLLDFYAETAKKLQAITTKQMFFIAKQILDLRKLLGGWTKSVKK